MSIGQFLGTSFQTLRQGSIITGPFEQISNFFPETAPVLFGALLKYGSSKKKYVTMVGDETDASVFAGIAVNEIAASSSTYPGVKVQYEIAEPGNVLITGSIVVPFSTAAEADVANATEGAKVYLDAVTGLVSDTINVAANLLIPNLVFTGDSETVNEVLLVGVRKLY